MRRPVVASPLYALLADPEVTTSDSPARHSDVVQIEPVVDDDEPTLPSVRTEQLSDELERARLEMACATLREELDRANRIIAALEAEIGEFRAAAEARAEGVRQT